MGTSFSITNRIVLYSGIFLICYGFISGQEFDANLMFNPPEPNHQLIPEFDDSYGVLFRNLNNRGGPEIFTVRFRNLNRYLVNKQYGNSFLERTIRSGLGGNLEPRELDNLELGATSSDIDNDGDQDIMIVGWGATTHIFSQTARGEFVDITETSGLELPMSGNGASFADIDNDGDLDVLISDEHHQNRLYLQTKPNTFTDVTEQYGLTQIGISQDITFADVNGDHFPECYVCNWLGPDYFYHNINGERFEIIEAGIVHLKDSYNSNNATFGDMDNDGDLDLLVTDRHGQSRLYENITEQNSDQIAFTDITRKTGLENFYPSYSGVIADFDNNGWQDVFFTNIGPNLLYLNVEGSFELAYLEQTRKPYYSTGAAVADMDNDGDLDLFVANKDTNSVLYINPLNNSNYLRIIVEGVVSNRDGIGTDVYLYENHEGDENFIGYRQLGSSSGYLSGDESTVHFGVQEPGKFVVRVDFPSGIERKAHISAVNQTITISEYSGPVKALYQLRDKSLQLVRSRQFWINVGLYIILLGSLSGFITIALLRYKWSAKQIAMYLAGSLLGLYLESESMRSASPQTVILVQIASLLVISTLFIVLWERIYQLEKKRFGYRNTLQTFSHQLLKIRDNNEMANRLVQVLHDTLHPRHVSFWLVTDEKAHKSAALGQEELDEDVISLSGQLGSKLHPPRILTMDGKEISKAAHGSHTASVVPIADGKELVGLVILLLSAPLKSEDESILSIIASQCALTLKNNQYIEDTRTLVKKVTEAEVREKYIHDLEGKNEELEKLFAELKQTQAQLIHSEKMSSLGQLVAGVAHELNNPIGYIYANMVELKKTIERLEQSGEINATEIDTIIAESMEGSQRVKEIVESLRRFSRLDEEHYQPTDIHAGIDSTLGLMRKEFNDQIRVIKDYGKLPMVHCQPGQINQVFMNILLNAVQAIEGRGTITIRTTTETDKVAIDIMDTGTGISKEKCDHIFEPFYTTKPVGQGTGLGLSISYGIITNHGGTLKVKSKPGDGTTFTIRLPIQGNGTSL